MQNWFGRVVHQRDRMDAWLDNMCEHRDWRIKAASFSCRRFSNFNALAGAASAAVSLGVGETDKSEFDLTAITFSGNQTELKNEVHLELRA